MEATAQASARRTLHATAVLSGGPVVSLVTGLISAKVTAVLLGPHGVGYVALLQSTLGLAVLAATFSGVSAAIVPTISKARAAADPHEEVAARAAAWVLWLAFGAMAATLLVAFREPVARLAFGGADRSDAVPILAAALVVTLARTVHTNVLAAHGRIAQIGRIAAGNSVLGPAVLLPMIWLWREAAVPWALLASTVGSVLISAYVVHRSAAPPTVRVGSRQVIAAARRLLRFGIPFNTSGLAGAGVQLAIPILVLHALGSAEVGFYRAAAGTSMAYLSILTSSLGQDYFPRVSACVNDAARLSLMVNQQARVLLLLSGPLILALLAFAPFVIPMVYTAEFSPAVPLVEWQLIGDLFRVAGSSMAYAILARSRSVAYLIAELTCGVVLLGLSWIGLRTLQLEGLGLAGLTASVLTFFVYAAVARRTINVGLTRDTWRLIGVLVTGALIIRLASYSALDSVRIAVGLTVAVIAGLRALLTLRAETGGLRALIGWRRAA